MVGVGDDDIVGVTVLVGVIDGVGVGDIDEVGVGLCVTLQFITLISLVTTKPLPYV